MRLPYAINNQQHKLADMLNSAMPNGIDHLLVVLCLLKPQLQWTDSPIDWVVYRLHGLMEEEIKVVEVKK